MGLDVGAAAQVVGNFFGDNLELFGGYLIGHEKSKAAKIAAASAALAAAGVTFTYAAKCLGNTFDCTRKGVDLLRTCCGCSNHGTRDPERGGS